ncbi:MinD/ParA family ATP-binding protein [Ideonella livida]|uniref:Flagellar biosynthesis protein n=1 Tax=Ideonella livida TaxID=2707176 RepID=A0A7C9TNM1_9BURK|nr:flagellar biosynthesis protein [Ideonella livida]NDY94023.1 flagellar biosynthesis protein [Ideonella livida]
MTAAPPPVRAYRPVPAAVAEPLAELARAALSRPAQGGATAPLGRADQADGLRRMFQVSRLRLMPVVANVQVAAAPQLLERLALALVELGAQVLVVDAADNAPHPHELVDIDLAAAVEALGPQVRYLAARGLPRRHVNARGSCEAWLSTVEQVAAGADVVLLHAQASDLARMLGHREVCPVLTCGLDAAGLTEAYAAMKLLTTRLGLKAFDLVVAADARARPAQQVADRLVQCGDAFLGTVLRHRLPLDCAAGARGPAELGLSRLVADHLLSPDELALPARLQPLFHAPTAPQGHHGD